MNSNPILVTPVANFLKINLDFVQIEFVTKIPNLDVREAVNGVIANLKTMINIMADSEGEKDIRIGRLWLDFTNKDLLNFGEAELNKLFLKIEDQKIRSLVMTLAIPVMDTLRVLTDEIKPNEAQIAEVWTGFIKDPVVQVTLVNEVVKPLLDEVIESPTIVNFIVGIITASLASIPVK